jgi:hypothetical protein
MRNCPGLHRVHNTGEENGCSFLITQSFVPNPKPYLSHNARLFESKVSYGGSSSRGDSTGF